MRHNAENLYPERMGGGSFYEICVVEMRDEIGQRTKAKWGRGSSGEGEGMLNACENANWCSEWVYVVLRSCAGTHKVQHKTIT